MPLAGLKQSAAFGVDESIVAACLDPNAIGDALFVKGWRVGPGSLTRTERCALAGVTGHIAESVTELLLDSLDWRILWHLTGPGRHGVDLVVLAPGDLVVAVEVKGTLVSGRIPRLSRREMTQMSAAWVDKADNPGMAELELDSEDVYGGVVVVNFADMIWRAALTVDFVKMQPVTEFDQLGHLGWLVPVDDTSTEHHC
jgi:hypothetical protein